MPTPGYVEIVNAKTGVTLERLPADAREICANDPDWSTDIQPETESVTIHPDVKPKLVAEPAKAPEATVKEPAKAPAKA